MDIEDYYYRTKNRKQRKFEGSSKRKGNTLRGRNRPRAGAFGEVTKEIRVSGDWDADRIDRFCQDVLQDGDLSHTARRPMQTSHNTAYSLKNKRRWKLCSEIRSAALQNANEPEMPNVAIVEKVAGSSIARCLKPNVTRATYLVSVNSIATGGQLKGFSGETRLVMDKKPKVKYSCEHSYDDERKRLTKRSPILSHHAEVTYVFQQSCPKSQYPEDKTEHHQRKMLNSKFNAYQYELDAYYNEGVRGDSSICSENEYDSESEDNGSRVDREIVVNLRDEIVSAYWKRKLNSSNAKVAQQRPVSKFPNKKGKAITLPLSERTGDLRTEDSQCLRSSTTLKMSTEVIHEFIATQESSERVSIANCVPISFTIDLSLPGHNSIKEGPCHLLFETDYDPDIFDSIGEPMSEDHSTVQVTMFSYDDGIVRAASKCLKDLGLLGAGNAKANTPIARIVAIVKESLSELMSARGSCNNDVKEGDKKMKKRLFEIYKELPQKLSVRSVCYPSTDSLRNSVKAYESGPDADYAFEMVPDFSINLNRKCGSCQHSLVDLENPGMAIRDCRHWFCRKCWSNQVLHSEDFVVKCMSPECTNTANFSMKMILCSLEASSSHRLNRGKLGKESAYRCPNTSCRGVVKTAFPTNQSSILSCLCGTAWCGTCGKDPHWPASCNTAKLQRLEYEAMSLKRYDVRSVKECPQCYKDIEIHHKPWMGVSCPHCAYLFQCWKCMGRCRDDWLPRVSMATKRNRFFYYHHPCKREETPEKKTLMFFDFSSDTNAPTQVYHSTYKFMKSLLSYDFDSKVERRASPRVEGGCRDEMASAVSDLLITRNQLGYTILWTMAELRHGISRNSSKRKYIGGLLKKMETIRDAIEWLLLNHDCDSANGLVPEAYKFNSVKAVGILKQIANAFKRP